MDPKDFSDAAVSQQNQPTSFEPDRPEFFGDNSAPQPTMTPGSDIQPVSQTPVPQSTVPLPDFMLNRKVPEPTQTPADQKKNLIKLGIIAGIVLVVVLIGYSIFASIMHSKNSDEIILSLLENNSETITQIEGITINAESGNLEVQHLFNEQNHTLLNELSEKATSFASELKDIKPNYASSSISSDLSSIKTNFLILAPAFSESVELYNKAYEAYINNNLDPLRELLNEENSKPEEERNQSIISVANRFIDYAEEKATLSKNISAYKCNINNLPADIPSYDLKSCDYLVYEYNDITNSISESYPVIIRIFSAYTDYSIDEENSLVIKTNNIITTLGGSTNEESEE